ncbi:MAG: glycoside hydrolase family 16 protein [Thermoanaerobaculia bacterium]
MAGREQSSHEVVPHTGLIQAGATLASWVIGLMVLLGSVRADAARTISFAGLTWEVRSGTGAPGNGCWSDDPASVWVDGSGLLHLKIRQLPDGRWCQAEVSARSIADYGAHLFWTNSRIDVLSPTTVLGLFLYADDHHEIDIEATRSFGSSYNLLYVLQPYYPGAPRSSYRTSFALNGPELDSYSSHRLTWSSDRSVVFGSWHGHCASAPCGGEIAAWTYSGPNTPTNDWLLQPTINLWINGANPSSPQEVIIGDYSGPQVPRPTVVTGPESAVTSTSATLSGTVNPNGWSSIGWFQYGTSTSYSSTTEASGQSVGSGTAEAPISKAVSGLACGTLYHFRAVGRNVAGDAYGPDRTFTTGTCPAPTATTTFANQAGPTFATLNGSVNPNGASTTITFEYGLTTSYGSTSAAQIVTGTTSRAVSMVVAPLACNTTYHFRVRATNPGGTTYGSDKVFSATACGETPPRRRPVRR